jgi:hypothetical protein
VILYLGAFALVCLAFGCFKLLWWVGAFACFAWVFLLALFGGFLLLCLGAFLCFVRVLLFASVPLFSCLVLLFALLW